MLFPRSRASSAVGLRSRFVSADILHGLEADKLIKGTMSLATGRT